MLESVVHSGLKIESSLHYFKKTNLIINFILKSCANLKKFVIDAEKEIKSSCQINLNFEKNRFIEANPFQRNPHRWIIDYSKKECTDSTSSWYSNLLSEMRAAFFSWHRFQRLGIALPLEGSNRVS